MLVLVLIGDYELSEVWRGEDLGELRQSIEDWRVRMDKVFPKETEYHEKEYQALMLSLDDWENGEFGGGSWHVDASNQEGVYKLKVYEPFFELLVLMDLSGVRA